MNIIKQVLLFSFLVSVLSACNQGVDSPKGFSLPKGDVNNGKLVFIKHNCSACHSIEGIDTNDIEKDIESRIMLGGKSTIVTTYAQLVTSVINPSHRIAKSYKPYTVDDNGLSVMRNYNDVMTVAELIDLVAYLQSEYKVEPDYISPYSNVYTYL